MRLIRQSVRIAHTLSYFSLNNNKHSFAFAFANPSQYRRETTAVRMSSSTSNEEYTPPKVWKYESSEGSKFSMNRPTAGPRFEKELPVGKHPIQLHSMATPNGQKVTIMLEELLAAGHDAEYDAYPIKIMEEDQFGSGFVAINPNSKIPAMSVSQEGKEPLRIFESGSILLYLAERFNAFLPADKRTETLNWLFWQMGSAPYVGGGFGHFYQYANVKNKYAIDRFTMETKRQLDVLNRQLEQNKYMVGDEYTIADIAIYPWYGWLVLGQGYGDAATFLNVEEDYPHVIRWAKMIEARPAVQRGSIVNKFWGDNEDAQLLERHSADDFQKTTAPQP
jgi:GST-like protein